MQHVRKGRQWSTRASVPSFDSDSLQQLAFPGDSGANDAGPAKEDTSHVARRRLASEPAHELDVDEVELIDDALTAPVEASRARRDGSKVEALPSDSSNASQTAADDAIDVVIEDLPRETSPEPTSLAPLAMDYSNAKAPFDLPLAPPGEPRARPRFGALIACSLVAVGIAAGFIVRASSASFDAVNTSGKASGVAPIAPREPVAPRDVAPEAAAPKASAPVDTSVPEATPLPPPPSTTGTILGAADHRLWVDGALVTGFEASVHCGKHTVQVGSAGTPRTVDVPCGDSIKVAP